ncbi:MAG: hypothetical protein AAFP97_03180 [Pseudomonadota bacterium]
MSNIPTALQQQLHPNETILWASIDAFSKDDQRIPDTAREALKRAAISFVVAGLVFAFAIRVTAIVYTYLVLLSLSIAIFAYGVVQLRRSRFFRRFTHFTFFFYTPSFVSCVITNARVFLFNQPDGPLTVLNRDDLASLMPELDHGTSALMFTRQSTGKRYLFITDDFVALMRVLKTDAAPEGVPS